ncbi:MAG: alpha/beta hydrolase fold domain-containing protein [Verrucomicrobia bacterium]|nr:alpha/beta hydrolase fold domain-containing protein [Verrucomicrobiota bacterium]
MPSLPRYFCLVLLCPLLAGAAEPDSRLQEWLKRYPDADANRDGVLTLEEAQAYAKVLRGKAGRKSTGKNAIDEGTAPAGERVRKPTPTHADVSYGPHERHKLDLWLAPSPAPTPLVVFIHGGGFVNGSKAGAHAGMIQGCLDAKVSFMAINYRYRTTAPIQEILRDCARAVQFVRHHARDYNLDPARIAAYGGSAGAGTSLWLAFHPDLANPTSPDPVLRESSRIAAAGAINTQATYHLRRWPEFLGTPGDWNRPGEIPAFYGLKTEAELDGAGAILADVDMLGLVSRDDPPVFLYTSHPAGTPGNRGHYLHHPGHAQQVKRVCDAAGVTAVAWFAFAEPRLEGDYLAELRRFLFQHLKVPPS